MTIVTMLLMFIGFGLGGKIMKAFDENRRNAKIVPCKTMEEYWKWRAEEDRRIEDARHGIY